MIDITHTEAILNLNWLNRWVIRDGYRRNDVVILEKAKKHYLFFLTLDSNIFYGRNPILFKTAYGYIADMVIDSFDVSQEFSKLFRYGLAQNNSFLETCIRAQCSELNFKVSERMCQKMGTGSSRYSDYLDFYRTSPGILVAGDTAEISVSPMFSESHPNKNFYWQAYSDGLWVGKGLHPRDSLVIPTHKTGEHKVVIKAMGYGYNQKRTQTDTITYQVIP